MQITSTAFQDGDKMDAEYGKDGGNKNPPLTFSEIPDGAESLVLLVEDPDAPSGIFTHWILYDMSPATLQVLEGITPQTAKTGRNDFGNTGYDGPQPPSGMHRYYFKLFALNKRLDNLQEPDRSRIYEAMDGSVLANCEIYGLFGSE